MEQNLSLCSDGAAPPKPGGGTTTGDGKRRADTGSSFIPFRRASRKPRGFENDDPRNEKGGRSLGRRSVYHLLVTSPPLLEYGYRMNDHTPLICELLHTFRATVTQTANRTRRIRLRLPSIHLRGHEFVKRDGVRHPGLSNTLHRFGQFPHRLSQPSFFELQFFPQALELRRKWAVVIFVGHAASVELHALPTCDLLESNARSSDTRPTPATSGLSQSAKDRRRVGSHLPRN